MKVKKTRLINKKAKDEKIIKISKMKPNLSIESIIYLKYFFANLGILFAFVVI